MASSLEQIQPPEIVGGRGRMLRAFRHRNFTIFFAGQLISFIGTWSQMLALSWLVWRMTGSALWLGLIGFITQLPIFLFGLAGGAIADRHDRLRMLMIMQVLAMAQALLLAWLAISGAVKLWHLVGLGMALGTVSAFELPLRQAFVMDMVGKKDLLNAVSLSTAMFHTSRILGPMAAGFLVSWKGEGICFLFNGATFLVLIIALCFIDRQKLMQAKRSEENLWEAIMEGLGHVGQLPAVKLSLILIALLAGLGMQFTALMPIFADEVFQGGALKLGWLMGASGVGSLLGALWLARRHSSEKLLTLSTSAAVLFSLALIVFSMTANLIAALCGLAIVGMSLTIAFSGMGTLMQQASPDHLRGRMMSLYSTTFMGAAPFGQLFAGGLARAIGAPVTIFISGVICLAAAGWTRYRSARLESGERGRAPAIHF